MLTGRDPSMVGALSTSAPSSIADNVVMEGNISMTLPVKQTTNRADSRFECHIEL